jgi:long-chain fatty acid transport protein
MKKLNSWLVGLGLALSVLAPSAQVRAGGLYLFDRGTRALGRGGAFVAGADDPSSLWYNPAGLAASGKQIYMDATVTFFQGSFQPTDASGAPTGPKVDAQPMVLPIPTFAISHNFGLEDWTFGAGVFAPNTVIMGWPDTVRTSMGVQPSPARYSLLSLKGSLQSALTAGFAWHGIEGLSIGADIQVQMARYKVKTALSGCDGFACAFPQDPEFDSTVTLDMFPAVGVSGALGFTYDLVFAKIGASVTLPYTLKGDAKLDVNLPSSPIFDNASVQGDRATMSIKFPWIYRVGGEIKPADWLRMEGAFVYEAWSSQKDIPVTPHHVSMQNVRGLGNYDIGPIKIMRNMQNTWSVRGGYEATLPEDWLNVKIVLRGGLAYEKGGFKSSSLSPMTIDTNKVILTGGFGINLADSVRMDGVAGWIFMTDPKVRNSEITAPQAIRPSPTTQQVIGNGNYKAEAFYLGGGLSFMLD